MVERQPATVAPLPHRLDQLTIREFGALFTVFVRIRMVGLGFTSLLILILLIVDSEPWKIGLAAAAALVLLITSIRDRRHLHDRQLSPNKIAELLASAMFAHFTLITLTGGLHSPFVIVLPAVSVAVGLGVGRVRPVAIVISAAITIVWILAADDFVGTPRLIPDVLAAHLPKLGGPAFAITMASLLTFLLGATATFGLIARGVVERAVAVAHEAQAETLATMRDRNQELWSLSGTIAHELKNPLASVRGLGSLLARRVEPGTKQAERMGVLLDEVERMGSIIDEFLNFSRPLTAMTRRPTDPTMLTNKVIALHQPLAQAREITLESQVSSTTALRCDPRKVTQVLVNLLHNAIEASPSGSTVRLFVRDDGEAVLFEVSDQGPGLDPEIRARLFRPGATTKPHGSGIGLAVARSIGEQHGGTLTLEDHPDGGCRATLRLPYADESSSESPSEPEPEPLPSESSP